MFAVRIIRLVRKHFGSLPSFAIWLTFVLSCVYVIDTFVISHRRNRPTLKEAVVSDDRDAQKPPPKPLLLRNKIEDVFLIADPQRPPVDPADMDLENEAAAGVKQGNDLVVDQKQEADEEPPQEKKSPYDNSEPRNCGVAESCPKGQYSFMVRSGYGRNVSAKICFNGDYLISATLQNHHRGMNVVIINEKSLVVDDIQVFDVYYTDIGLLDYMKDNMNSAQIVLIASEDEASYSLKEGGRKAIGELGSSIVTKLAFRDNYVIIGKRGLAPGKAIEKLAVRKSGFDYADVVELSGCLAIPLELNDANKIVNDVKKRKAPADTDLKVLQGADEMENCGVQQECTGGSFPVRMYTGRENKAEPKICVNGKYVLAGDLNGAGRGLNFAVVDPISKEILRVAHFDTFSADSIAIEMFMEVLNENEIILGVAYDEASTKLEKHIRDMIEKVGSSYISQLAFRDVWAFVGQKGIKGYSPIEEFSPSGASPGRLSWPKPIDLKACIPPRLIPLGQKKTSSINLKRQQFCQKHDGYGKFCSPAVIEKRILPVPPTDAKMANDPIFMVPIVIVAGIKHNVLVTQLEQLFANPGLKASSVRVFHDEKFKESGELAEVFGVESVSLPSSNTYADVLQKAVVKAWSIFPTVKYVIFLEEEVNPSQDFLNFMRQCWRAVEDDETLAGISGWNPNGYTATAGNDSIAFRTELFPGLGFMLKRSFYQKFMADKMTTCCSVRAWEGWKIDAKGKFYMIAPENSRVSRGPVVGQNSKLVRELFGNPRHTVGSGQHKIVNAAVLEKEKYSRYVTSLIEGSTPLNGGGVELCLTNKTFQMNIRASTAATLSVYYNSTDNDVLIRLCRCFQLHASAQTPGYGMYQSMLRFSVHGKSVFLIGSKSPFYSLKPSKVSPLSSGEIKR